MVSVKRLLKHLPPTQAGVNLDPRSNETDGSRYDM